MTIFEFEQIYDKEDKTAEDVDLISDVMERCGEQSDDNFLSRELLRKQALLHAAILEVEAGNKKSFAPQMEQYNRAKLELENYRKEKEDEAKRKGLEHSTFADWFCFIEKYAGFAIDKNRNLNDFIVFVKMLKREAKPYDNKRQTEPN